MTEIRTIDEPEKLAELLRSRTSRTTDLEEFGRSIYNSVLREAIEEFEKGNARDGMVEIATTTTVKVRVIDLPSSEDIDVCVETCHGSPKGFWACYIDCTSPIPDLP